jgi:hypothetical protein
MAAASREHQAEVFPHWPGREALLKLARPVLTQRVNGDRRQMDDALRSRRLRRGEDGFTIDEALNPKIAWRACAIRPWAVLPSV